MTSSRLQEMRQRERQQKESQEMEDDGYPRQSPPSLKTEPRVHSGDKNASNLANRGKRWEQLYELVIVLLNPEQSAKGNKRVYEEGSCR